jgi:hypothetical protein
MATNDTDPQRDQPFHDDTSRTEPGGPPPPHPPDAASNAASLLAGLAESAQPTQDVRETEGHVAAAYAAAPHRPPRPNEKTVENPGVFINATVPLAAPPPSSGRVKLGPPAPPVVSMKGDPTVLGGARLVEAIQNQTDPGERARNQLRVYFAAIGGVVVAGLIAIAVMIVMRPPANPAPSPSPPASAPTVSSAAPSIDEADPVATASSPASPTASPAPSAAPTVTAKPTGHARPRGSSSLPSSRPSGTFAEPDRHL